MGDTYSYKTRGSTNNDLYNTPNFNDRYVRPIRQINTTKRTVSTNNSNVQITGSFSVTGSVSFQNTLKLESLDVLPTGEIGMMAVSESKLWFYNGSWTSLV